SREATMPTIIIPRPEGDVVITMGYDESGRLLLGSSDNCQVQIPGLQPVHAYLAAKSDHVDLFLAPGAKIVCDGREVWAEPLPIERFSLEQFRLVGRDFNFVYIGGVRVEDRREY